MHLVGGGGGAWFLLFLTRGFFFLGGGGFTCPALAHVGYLMCLLFTSL